MHSGKVFSDASRWLFSFMSICDALKMALQSTLKKLKHWITSPLDTAPATR